MLFYRLDGKLSQIYRLRAIRMKKTLIIILTFFIFPGADYAQAEILMLKSGKQITAPIVEHTADYIVANISGINITYYVDEIQEIRPEERAKVKIDAPTKPALEIKRESTQSIKTLDQVSGIKIQPMAETAKTAGQEKLVEFLNDIKSKNDALNMKLVKKMEEFNQVREENDKSKAMTIVLDRIGLVQERIGEISKIEAVKDAQNLKKIVLDYYQSMIEVEGYVLKKLAGEDEGLDSIESAIQVVQANVLAYQKELALLSQKLGLNNVPDLFEKEKIKLTASGQDQQELAMLRAQTSKLIEANKQLQEQTRVLIARNNEILTVLKNIISAQVEHMGFKQKKEFLLYLNQL